MTGPKRNEGATKVGERTGTRCVVKFVGTPASKARQVLDLIRGLDVRRADQVLQFTDREVATTIRKALASAVANAVHNDEQDADELKVVACFADEGPTMKRFRPRARGRAMRVRKRSSHITVVVGRMTDSELNVLQAKEGIVGAGGRRRARTANPAAAARRARVERSRQQRAAAAEETPSTAPVADEVATTDTTDETPENPYGAGVLPDEDGNGPEGYEIKGNADSMLYHTPDSRYYKATKAEVWFKSEEDAEAAGFSKPGSQTDEDTESGTGAEGSASDEAQSSEEAGTADEGDK